jgi:hypothetical protein
MDHISSTTATLDQTDEDILTTTVSDAALEAAAGMQRGALSTALPPHSHNYCC